jgi:hypothetical protein
VGESFRETLTWCCVRYIPFIFMKVSNESSFLEVDAKEGYKYFRVRLWEVCVMDCVLYIRFYIVAYPFQKRRVQPRIARLTFKERIWHHCVVLRHIFVCLWHRKQNGMHQNEIVEGSQVRGVNKYKNLRPNEEDWPHLNRRVRLDRECCIVIPAWFVLLPEDGNVMPKHVGDTIHN